MRHFIIAALFLSGCQQQAPDPLDAAIAADARNETDARIEKVEDRLTRVEILANALSERELAKGEKAPDTADLDSVERRVRRIEQERNIEALKH